MCGRYTLHTSPAELAEAFSLFRQPELALRYNIAPTQPVAAVRCLTERRDRELVLLHWGLIPAWAQEPSLGSRMINARAETVASKPAFRTAFKRRRCLVLADGFYEWQQAPAAHSTSAGGAARGRRARPPKQPYYITVARGGPFAFAGLWEHWQRDPGSPIDSCTIITTTANQDMARVHDRMPVILEAADYDRWLDPDEDNPQRLQSLLQPYPEGELVFTPVSTLVNNPRNDVAECIEPLPTPAD